MISPFSQRATVQKSTSNDFPVDAISLPSEPIIGPFIVPVNRAMEHVQSPLLVRWDGVFPPGTTDERLVGTEDNLPTFIDAAGYSPPEVK